MRTVVMQGVIAAGNEHVIENYFMTGARFNWISPKDATGGALDGSIIDNPLLIKNPMAYDGMDGELLGSAIHARTAGLTRKGMTIPYRWLAYAPGRTARCVLAGGDLLTGPMSGCLITTWTDNGVQYAGHVGTIDGNGAVNRLVKREFAAAMYTQLQGFNPAAAWTQGEIMQKVRSFKSPPRSNVYALVTGPGVFYSILIFTLAHQGAKSLGGKVYERCVGGIKHVPSMSTVAIKAKLLE